MTDFVHSASKGSLTVRLWRGQQMCLIGMDVDTPDPAFVGFSIEVKAPGAAGFQPLRNRLAFAYPAAKPSLAADRQFPSLQAPFQKFRWVHFPAQIVAGSYTYRVTVQLMHKDNVLAAGDAVECGIELLAARPAGAPVQVGFTRGFASSQAFNERYGTHPDFFPKSADGPTFDKSKAPAGAYEWLGFEAYQLIFGTLNEVDKDPGLTLDAFAYDLDEPDVIAGLAKLGKRLRLILDNSGTHAAAGSGPGQAEKTITAAGGTVQRMHFRGLQHNKVLIVKRNGKAEKVLCGSTNFSFSGLYLQSNNAVLFQDATVAQLFDTYFQSAWADPAHWDSQKLAQQWTSIAVPGVPLKVCISPHADPSVSLKPVADAIDTASSTVLFAIAFLNQTSPQDLVRSAVDRLTGRRLFSYGIADKSGGLAVMKPDGSEGIVSWAYLKQAVPPFGAEFSSSSGIHEHNKFVVVDFNLPTARVFTGSSNLSESGEKNNGDHLLEIQSQEIAVAYAVEAVLIFDHLHFAQKVDAASKPEQIVLQKPVALVPAAASWFDRYYVKGSQMEQDRLLFAHGSAAAS